MRAEGPVRIGIRCDADVRTGVGHLVRCIALAEELLGRGVEVVFLSRVDNVAWASRQLSTRGLRVVPPASAAADLARQTLDLGLDAVVLDRYELDPDTGKAVRERGVVVLDILDGAFGGQEADLYVDQNLHAERSAFSLPSGAERLAGVRYVLLRDVVRAERPPTPRAPRPGAALEVLAFFGGTDAFGAAPVIVPLILRTGAAMHLKVVAPRPETARRLERVPTSPGQSVEILGPRDDLPLLAAASDLVATASGSSPWEAMCLGVAVAVVAVSENQGVGYQALLAEKVALGLGRLDQLHTDAAQRLAAHTLSELLRDPERRAAISARGWALVDGRGRERVADTLLKRIVRAGPRSAAYRGEHRG
jgi:spore coat polysaccharide biosynthesis predicted glycosyltransferase SpsG